MASFALHAIAMRSLIFIISILFFAACKDNSQVDTIQLPPETSKVQEIKLADSLGSVTFSIPARYDTTFQWTDYSDCGKPCEKIKYRLQPKSLKIVKESGFIWTKEPKESIEQFTIIHPGFFPFHSDTDSSSIFQYHLFNKENIIKHPDTYRIKEDTVEKIGDRHYSIIVINLYDSVKDQTSMKLYATTTIKGNIVAFNYELLKQGNDPMIEEFINNSKYYLRTIRISNGM